MKPQSRSIVESPVSVLTRHGTTCGSIYGAACKRECEFVLIEIPEDLTQCRKKCQLELADCIVGCKPWWKDWW
ncbi:hypothetical protein NP493_364g00011 [Ridgeia piscesae]|uniref:Uncharacterized protein n=1 Tax=Ridgeia piscesae TaxID=27915 RepID=A0AAD9L2F9_RIDPI|nr:hypothetical protein NP493_364g00011 [Ridgeia piscesae]